MKSISEICFTAFDHGITHFDLANNYGPKYGSAESNFGKILKEHFLPYRDELIISTKAGYDMWPGPYGDHGSRKYLIASLDQSLKCMGLDYVDIFYHHRMDPETPLEETMLAQGLLKDRYFSGIPADSRVRTDGRFLHEDQILPEKIEKLKALNEIASNRNQSLAEMALAWLLHNGAVTSVLVGASKPAQILANVKAAENTAFSDDELKEIDRLSK